MEFERGWGGGRHESWLRMKVENLWTVQGGGRAALPIRIPGAVERAHPPSMSTPQALKRGYV
jgi:hypothetical protein